MLMCAFQPQPDGTDSALLTVAEVSGYRATSTSAELEGLLDRIAATSPLARRAEMGKTQEGRSIPMLIIADPPVAGPAEAAAQVRENGKLLVFILGNIHAGEVDGKEALPMLARDLIAPSGRPHPMLTRLIVVMAPNYNADGNDRFGKGNRPGQVGPEEGMGTRENAAGLDLNRDYIKMECPETRALAAFINEWDPYVVVDLHTTNGSYHRYLITYDGPKAPAGDALIVGYSRDTLLPAIGADFERRSGARAFFYGNFEGAFGDAVRGHTRWETFSPEARFGTSYIGLRGRLSVLVESYSYATYKDRVLGTLDFCRSSLEVIAREADEIARRVAAVDEAAERGPVGGGPGSRIVLRSRAAPAPEKVTIMGFVEEEKDGHSVSTGVPKDYEVQHWDRFEAALAVELPGAYIMDRRAPGIGGVVENLRRHGVVVEQLAADETLDTHIYRVERADAAAKPFQNHALRNVEVTLRADREAFGKGTIVVRTAQRLGRLGAYLLEPQCEDGLTTWNFFDASLTVGDDFPVRRVHGPLECRTESLSE